MYNHFVFLSICHFLNITQDAHFKQRDFFGGNSSSYLKHFMIEHTNSMFLLKWTRLYSIPIGYSLNIETCARGEKKHIIQNKENFVLK